MEGKRSAKEKVSDGIRQGIGVLSAFKEALEETIQDARERGDLSTDRAKQVMKEALDRAQTAAEGARERFDFVQQGEHDALREQVEAQGVQIEAQRAQLEELRTRLAALETRGGGPSTEPPAP